MLYTPLYSAIAPRRLSRMCRRPCSPQNTRKPYKAVEQEGQPLSLRDIPEECHGGTGWLVVVETLTM